MRTRTGLAAAAMLAVGGLLGCRAAMNLRVNAQDAFPHKSVYSGAPAELIKAHNGAIITDGSASRRGPAVRASHGEPFA